MREEKREAEKKRKESETQRDKGEKVQHERGLDGRKTHQAK